MINKYGKAILSITMVIALAVLSTSCGTKLPEAGDYTEADNASGGAVDSKQNAAGTERKESVYDRLPFCNDEHYYQFDDNGDLLQCRLGRLQNDASRRTYRVKNGKDVNIWRVNNKEILYVTEKNELWRIPIGKDKDGACLQVEKAERVLTDKNEIIDIYADDSYIVYISFSDITGGVYHEYDRNSGKELTVDRTGKENFTAFASHNLLDVVGGEYVLLGSEYRKMDKTDSVSESIQTGIYIHKLGSGNVTKIDDSFVSDHEQVPYESARAVGEKFYYYGGYKWDKEKKAAEEVKQDIRVYDARTGKREIFVSVKELMKCAKDNKARGAYNFFKIRDIFIDKGKMYIWAYNYGAYVVYSKGLIGDSELKYEEKASKLLNNIAIENIREMETDVIDGKLLIGYYEDDGSNFKHIEKYYDFTSGVHKDVKESDYEGVYWCYGLRYGYMR